MSLHALPPNDAADEPASIRRARLIREGAKATADECRDRLAPHCATLSALLDGVASAAYRRGLDTMADIVQPDLTAAESGREMSPVKVSPETQALAINGVIRLLVTARTEFALGNSFRGDVTIPRAEAVAMSAVVEAALGLNTEKLLESDLFEKLP